MNSFEFCIIMCMLLSIEGLVCINIGVNASSIELVNTGMFVATIAHFLIFITLVFRVAYEIGEWRAKR